MNFSLKEFWLSFIIGMAMIALVKTFTKNPRVDRLLLAGFSLTLLGLESLPTLGVFLFVFGVTYLGLSMASGGASKLFIGGLATLQLLPLLFYKYSPFVVSQVTDDLPDLLRDLAIPVGLSFYTFQMVGLVVDTLKDRQPLPTFLNCLNFASFFPQIVAGPIERRGDLLPQMESFRFRLNWEDVELGARWVILGLFMKLTLADNLAAQRANFEVDAANPFLVWLECLMFAFRVYNDFAGYSFVAFGLARMLGIRLSLNFTSPYWTTNFRDFWRHWHISLSKWFRDYLYIPLSGKERKWRPGLILFVFAVSGLWHGAGWNFAIWGAVHGVLVMLPPWSRFGIPKPLAWVIHIHLIVLTRLFFFERDIHVLLEKLGTIFSPLQYHFASLNGVMTAFTGRSALLGAVAILALSGLSLILEGLSLRRGKPYCLLTHRVTCLLLIPMIYLLQPETYHVYIYFNF